MKIHKISTKLGKPELNGTKLTVYHRTHTEELAGNICEIGFKAGVGAAYGVGIYSTYSYESSLQNTNLEGYGVNIIKSEMDVKNFLILDAEVAKMVYGANWKVIDQIRNVIGESKITGLSNPRECMAAMVQYSKQSESKLFTSEIAAVIANRYHFDKTGLNGIIYTGHRDGNCALAYKPILIVPLAHAHVDGKTYKNPSWTPCAERSVDELRKLQTDENRAKLYESERFRLVGDLDNQADRNNIQIQKNRYPNIPESIFNQVVSNYLYDDRIKVDQLDNITRVALKDVIDVEFMLKKLRTAPTVYWKEFEALSPEIKAKISNDIIAEIWENYMRQNPGHWSQIPESARKLIRKDIEAEYWAKAIKKNPANWKHVEKDMEEYLISQMDIVKPSDDVIEAAGAEEPDVIHETDEFNIQEASLKWIQDELAKLNIRAAKLGLPPLILEVMSANKKDKTLKIKIVGNVPVLKGWKLIAKVSIVRDEKGDEEDRIIQPLSEKMIPEELNLEEMALTCEHCKENRKRNDYYLVLNVDDNTYKTIGSSCLEDFIGVAGSSNPQAIASYAEQLRQTIVKFREDNQFSNKTDKQVRNIFRKTGVPVQFFLGKLMELYKQYSHQGRYGLDKYGIKAWAEKMAPLAWKMCMDAGYDAQYSKGLSAQDIATITNAIEWISNTKDEEPPASERSYMWDLKKQIDTGYVAKKRRKADSTITFAASLLLNYKKNVEEGVNFGKLLGNIGDEITFNGEIVFFKRIWTAITQQGQAQNKTSDYYVAKNSSGEKVAWYGTNVPQGTGDKIILKGKIDGYATIEKESVTSIKDVVLISEDDFNREEPIQKAKRDDFKVKNQGKDVPYKDSYEPRKFYRDGDIIEGKVYVQKSYSGYDRVRTYRISYNNEWFDTNQNVAEWKGYSYSFNSEIRATVKIVPDPYGGRARKELTNIEVTEKPKVQPAPVAPIAPVVTPAVAPAAVTPQPIKPAGPKAYRDGDKIEDDFDIVSVSTQSYAGGARRYVIRDSYGRTLSLFSPRPLGAIGTKVRMSGTIKISGNYTNLVGFRVVPKATPALPPPPPPQPVPQPAPQINPPTVGGNWYSNYRVVKALKKSK